jgi:hypothetical protein
MASFPSNLRNAPIGTTRTKKTTDRINFDITAPNALEKPSQTKANGRNTTGTVIIKSKTGMAKSLLGNLKYYDKSGRQCIFKVTKLMKICSRNTSDLLTTSGKLSNIS